jgi:hypothetical protein
MGPVPASPAGLAGRRGTHEGNVKKQDRKQVAHDIIGFFKFYKIKEKNIHATIAPITASSQ